MADDLTIRCGPAILDYDVLERRSLMQIRLLNTDQFYVPSRCATCGARFTPEAVLALAYDQAGVALGTICDECLHAGRGMLAQRAQGYAAQLRQHADALECVADEVLEVLLLGTTPSDDRAGIWGQNLNPTMVSL